jgi:hypothetical protein
VSTDDKESAANNSSNKIAHLRPCMGVLGESKKEKKKLLTRPSSLEMTHHPGRYLIDIKIARGV